MRLYEGYFRPDGKGVQVGGLTWTGVGDTGFYFLVPNAATGIHGLINSQGRVLVGPEGLLPSAEPRSPLARSVTALTEPRFVAAVRAAAH